jgi:hypothetical protein
VKRFVGTNGNKVVSDSPSYPPFGRPLGLPWSSQALDRQLAKACIAFSFEHSHTTCSTPTRPKGCGFWLLRTFGVARVTGANALDALHGT